MGQRLPHFGIIHRRKIAGDVEATANLILEREHLLARGAARLQKLGGFQRSILLRDVVLIVLIRDQGRLRIRIVLEYDLLQYGSIASPVGIGDKLEGSRLRRPDPCRLGCDHERTGRAVANEPGRLILGRRTVVGCLRHQEAVRQREDRGKIAERLRQLNLHCKIVYDRDALQLGGWILLRAQGIVALDEAGIGRAARAGVGRSVKFNRHLHVLRRKRFSVRRHDPFLQRDRPDRLILAGAESLRQSAFQRSVLIHPEERFKGHVEHARDRVSA